MGPITRRLFVTLLLLFLVATDETWLDPYQNSDKSVEDSLEDDSMESDKMESFRKPYHLFSSEEEKTDFPQLQKELNCREATTHCSCNFASDLNCTFRCDRQSLSVDPTSSFHKTVKCTCQLSDYMLCIPIKQPTCVHGFYDVVIRRCVCAYGFIGFKCEIAIRRPSTTQRPTATTKKEKLLTTSNTLQCLHGYIIDDICYCHPGYRGRSCELSSLETVSTVKPDVQADCINGYRSDTNYWECICDEGYTGWNCGTEIDSTTQDNKMELITTALPFRGIQANEEENLRKDQNQVDRWMKLAGPNRSHSASPFLPSGHQRTPQSMETGTIAELYKGIPLLFIVSLVAIIGILVFGSVLIVFLVKRRKEKDGNYSKLPEPEDV